MNSAWAADRNWLGRGADTFWNTDANWDTVPESSDSLMFRNFSVDVGRTATLNGNYTYAGVIHVGAGSSAENPYIFEATDPSYGLTIENDVWLGYREDGCLWIKSGTYTFGTSKKHLHLRRNFTLTVGDGTSTPSVTAKGNMNVAGDSNNVGTFTLNSGTVTVEKDLNVGNGSGSSGTINGISGDLRQNGSGNVFNVGTGANSTGTVIKDGGDWSCYYLRLGNASGATGTFTHNVGTLEVKIGSKTDGFAIGNMASGTFTLNGGIVTVNNTTPTRLAHQSGASGTLNLNGGTLVTKQVEKGSGSTGQLNFNGGTLKANAADGNGIIKSGVTVNVGENGGTIDSGNKAISVGAAIGGTGGMRFMGGNTITLNGANTYTGGTTIELGTKVQVSNTTANDTIVGNLIVDCSTYFADADNIEVFEYSAGGLTKDNVTFINCGDGTVAKVSDDGKKILVDFKARPWATVSADTTWSALVAAAGGAPASDASVSVKMTGDYTLTIDTDVTVGQIAFSNGDGSTLVVNNGSTLTVNDISGIGNIVNNGTLVKTGSETKSWPFSNDSTGVTIVSNGTLKVYSKNGTGTSNPTHTVRVKDGATFDLNGVANLTVSVALEEGAFFVNTGAAIGSSTYQTINLSLEGDSTVTPGSNFGLMAPSYASTSIALGSNTLSFNGTAGFWLENTTIIGDGTINVESGMLQCVRGGSTGADCTLNVGKYGTLRIDNNQSLTVKNFYNGGTYYVYPKFGLGMLEVTGTLTTGNQVTKLKLAAGATVKVKATGTAQVVSTEFSASGTITVDASEIDAQTLKAAGETGIPVLTVPTAQVPSGVIWAVSSAPIAGTRAKWRIDEGGNTKTLYIARSSGFKVIIR